MTDPLTDVELLDLHKKALAEFILATDWVGESPECINDELAVYGRIRRVRANAASLLMEEVVKTYKSVADMVRDLSENKEWGNAFADRLDSQNKQDIIRAFKMVLDEKESLEKALAELRRTKLRRTKLDCGCALTIVKVYGRATPSDDYVYTPTPAIDFCPLHKAAGKLRDACEYAAGSFSQVPSDRTVPPIVLHDCKDHLNAALAAAKEKPC